MADPVLHAPVLHAPALHASGPAWDLAMHRRGVRRTACGGLLFILLLLCGAAGMSCSMRAATLQEARQSLSQLGAALAEQTARSMQGVDLVLQDTIARLAEGGAGRLGGREVHALLRDRLNDLPQADALSIVGAGGRVLNFTRSWPPPPIDLSDRDYFRALSVAPGGGSYISIPVRNRGNANWTLYLARRLGADEDAFTGLLLGAMSLQYTEDFYKAVISRPGSSVTLLRRDGTILARFPHDESAIGAAYPDAAAWAAMMRAGGGTYSTDTDLDGQRELVSMHLLRDYPLVLQTAITEAAALQGWTRQSWVIAVAALIAAACVGLVLRKTTLQFGAMLEAKRVLAGRNAALEDAHRQLEAQAEALREGERRVAEKSEVLQTTLENIDQGLLMVTSDQVVAVYNQRVVEMMGLPEPLLARRPLFSEVLANQWQSNEFARTPSDVVSFVKAGGILGEAHVYERERPNGRVIEIRSVPLPGGGVVRTYTDVTARKAAEARIRYAADHDVLTGLANRALLHDHLERTISAEAGGGGSVALLYLDLDRFKLINDARGHDVGDRLLVEVSKRMKGIVREDDLVARMGGDEFAIVQAPAVQPEAAVALAERLTRMISEPFVINGARLTIGVSIGIAVFPGTGPDAETLRRNADIAMYQAKDAGRNTFRLYEDSMSAHQQEQFLLEQDLREAIGVRAFHLAYQPIVCAVTGRVVSYEALLRWNHPTRGVVGPNRFVPLAEDTGLIVPLGRWVLEAACREAATWRNGARVAVNLSPLQFRQAGLVSDILDILARTGLAPHRLELEVTEGVLIEDSGPVLAAMSALHEAGVSMNLDDFGTGYASLSYLCRFPFDKIKIDKSFVGNLGLDPQSDAIVEAILLLSQRLRLTVVAEGVETEAQLAALRGMQCPLVQGYLTGRPAPPEFARALQSAGDAVPALAEP